MIIIDKQTRGRHGNKVFHFNTLMQLSNMLNQECSTDHWDGYEFFEKTCKLNSKTTSNEIPPKDLIYNTETELRDKYSTGDWKLNTYSLCGPFFHITKKDPREFLKLKEKIELHQPNQVAVGIHIRGGDNRNCNRNSVSVL